MIALALLIPAALLLGLAGLGAFFWALKSGQFDDMDGAAARILIDDDEDDNDRGTIRERSGGDTSNSSKTSSSEVTPS